ncbi:MAG: hypothetical protein AAF938_07250 [Myxococcota bacterium]
MARRLRVLMILVAGLALVGTGFGFAGAQAEETADEDGSADSEAGVRRLANLNPAEQLAEGRRIQEGGDQLSRRVTAMLDEARQDRDIIRVTCLNDKLTQINANLRTLTTRLDNLEAAVQSQDSDRGGHEFTVITVLDQKLGLLEREAGQCIGEDIFETGATTVTTEIEDGAPTIDPAVLPDVPRAPVEDFIPPAASGTS